MKKLLAIITVFLFFGMIIFPSSGIQIENKTNIISNRDNTLYVGGNGSGNYSKIQDAVDDASDGDTVFVYDDSSPYEEYVIVDKSINLVGENKNTTVIETKDEDEIVYIISDEVFLTGFTIKNSIHDSLFYYSHGIHLISDNCKITDNIIKKNNCGILIEYCSSDNIINKNNIFYNRRGIYLYDRDECCFNNYVTENIIAHNQECGLYDFDFDSGTIATWNIIADNGKIVPARAGGIIKEDSYGVFHHNDMFFNAGNVEVFVSRYGSSWDDGSEGNYWDDWEENGGYPDMYIIPKEPWEADNIDYHPSEIPWMDSFIVGLTKGRYYALINESIDFYADITVDPSNVSWFWDFGDGNTSDEISPIYSYKSSGLYHINVTVTDSKNRSDTSKAIAQIGLAPDKPNITGPTKGKARVLYNYSVVAVDPDGDDVYYDIDWNDMTGEWDCGPYPSGEEIVFKHGFWYPDIYTISVRAKDDAGLESDWVDLEVYMPRDKSISSSPLLRFLERYPLLNRLLNLVNNNCFRK